MIFRKYVHVSIRLIVAIFKNIKVKILWKLSLCIKIGTSM